MSKMVTRVARAMCAAESLDPDYEIDGVPRWASYAPAARVAIEAMCEPTEDMCQAGNDTGAVDNDIIVISNRSIATVYRAMIDKALEP